MHSRGLLMTDSSKLSQQEISRRSFGILGLGAAGSAALTDCQADPGSAEENGADQAESGQNNPEGVFHGGNPFVAPPSGHFNMAPGVTQQITLGDRKSTRLNSSHVANSYAVFCLQKKTPLTPAN